MKQENGPGKLPAGSVKMASLVDYQEKSVVSRQIIGKSTGSVTIFAFDQGEGLSEHTAPFDALVYVLDGEADIIISGQANRLAAGDMIIMPANEPHSLKAPNRFKMALVMIRS